MRFRKVFMTALCAALLAGAAAAGAFKAGGSPQQAQLTAHQRGGGMRSKLDVIRRTLNSAIAGLNAKEKGTEATGDDPRARLGGLEKEAGKLLSEIADFRGKQERAERYDQSELDKLEAAVADLEPRVQA